jgi:shikimate dehydrogenase
MPDTTPYAIDTYCIFGHPVAHSRSPWIQSRFAEQTGQRLHYDRIEAPLDGFPATLAAFRARGGRGGNITSPFKFEVPALTDHQTERVRLAGAANTVRFDDDGSAHADNTDGIGLVDDITANAGVPLAGRRVLLLGAGGAAAGALGPLLEAGPERLVVANRTAARAEALVALHAPLARRHGADLAALPLDALEAGAHTFDVLVNASASSLGGAPVPVSPRVLRPGALALDMVYGPAARPFLAWAAEHGAVPRDGLGMLVGQAVESFAFWRGVRPDGRALLAELRAIVDAA